MMNIYCVGGTGCNVGKLMSAAHGKVDAGFAPLSIVYIDSSKSNAQGLGAAAENLYLVDDLDGSGKVRATNYAKFKEVVNDILHQYEPADVNLIVGSAGGGTGSVMGPLLAAEMMRRGKMVINLMVGTSGSKKEAQNTIDTLKSYEQLSVNRDQPMVVHFLENSSEHPRPEVNRSLTAAITLLAVTFSGQNAELDSEDLKNWLNYPKTTSYTSHITLLNIFTKDINIAKAQSLISAVTLVEAGEDYELKVPAEYHTHGFLPAAVKDSLANVEKPIHLGLVAGYFNPVIAAYQEKVDAFNVQSGLFNEKSILSGEENITDDGMIL